MTYKVGIVGGATRTYDRIVKGGGGSNVNPIVYAVTRKTNLFLYQSFKTVCGNDKFSRTICENCTETSENVRKMSGKWAENGRKSRKIPFCQVSHTHERTPGSVDRDPIVIWRRANDRTFAIPRLYDFRLVRGLKTQSMRNSDLGGAITQQPGRQFTSLVCVKAKE